MKPAPAIQQFERLIREATGNVVPPERLGFLEELARRRAQARATGSVEGYVEALASGRLGQEWEALIPLVTIKESYFFRAPQQFEAIRRTLLPHLLAARSGERRLRLWSAACARGEEPSSLAMLCAETLALAGWDWSVLATDLDEEALARARRGLFGERSVAQVPETALDRFFSRHGKLFELGTEVATRVSYLPLNLAHPPFDLPEAAYDLILLRNVLIYFRRPLQRRVVAQVAQRLAPGGFLVLGASETLWQIDDTLEAVDLGGCFAYRHPADADSLPGHRRRPAGRPHLESVEEADAGELLRDRAGPPERAVPPAAAAPRREVPPRLADAAPETVAVPPIRPVPAPLTPVVRRTAEPAAEPPVAPTAHDLLLAAARHLLDNHLPEALAAAERALEEDPSEPAAHALVGFLQDLAGRTAEAVAAYRAALYLDPALFQARLLLADCLLRLGSHDRAEHQFREVMTCLGSGRERRLTLLDELPLPERDRALRRCRQALAARQ